LASTITTVRRGIDSWRRKRTNVDLANRAICDFLHYAFIPSRAAAERKAIWYRKLLTNNDVPGFTGPDAHGAQSLLETIVAEQVAKFPGSHIVAAVTAGFDSRAIFSALLNVVAPARLTAYTVGHPGNADFDRAAFFTEGLGVEHILDRTDHAEFSTEASLARLKTLPRGLPKPISQPSLHQPDRRFAGLPFTSGFLGETIAGSHLEDPAPETFEEAIERFILWTRKSFIPTALDPAVVLPAWYDPKHALPQRELMPPSLMSFEDQLDLCYEQDQYIRLMNAPQYTTDELGRFSPTGRDMPPAPRITPLADPRWQRSFLKLSREDRAAGRFYKSFLKKRYPHVFKDLVHPNDPRWAKRNRLTNFSWARYWKENTSFRSAALAMFESLRRRKIWFDPMIAAELADKDIPGASRIIRGMCSLELNIRAGILPPPHSGSFVGWTPESFGSDAWVRLQMSLHRRADEKAAQRIVLRARAGPHAHAQDRKSLRIPESTFQKDPS
jgi:hypothetical protein